MEIIYNSKDIIKNTSDVGITIEDDCGEKLDSVKVIFNDAQNLWTSYYPKQNDTLEVRHEGYSTGVMYVDDISPRDNTMILQALPIKAELKTKKTAAWENITLPVLGYQKSAENSLKFLNVAVSPFVYQRTDQSSEGDLAFLSRLCTLEGALLKVHDNSIVIYNERDFESKEPIKTVSSLAMRDKSFKSSVINCHSRYTLNYGNLSVTAYDQSSIVCKSITRSDIPFYSIAEGERFASNLLYNSNKGKVSGSFEIPLDMSVAAGNVITICDMGMFDGNYFVSHVTHMPLDGISYFEVRKCFK